MVEYSLKEQDENFKEPKDNQVLIIYAKTGSFAAGDKHICYGIRPILVYYKSNLKKFFTIKKEIEVQPFLPAYTMPGWDLFNCKENEELLKRIKQNVN